MKKRLLKLLTEICEQTPNEGLLEILGSCFAAGDISQITDEELEKNLIALRELNAESLLRAGTAQMLAATKE